MGDEVRGSIVGFDHVQLAMPRDQEAVAQGFYEGILGLERVPKPSSMAQEGCWFERGTVVIHLGVEETFQAATKAHPGLLVSEFDDFLAGLSDAGVVVRPAEALNGARRVHVNDPFGNRIELIEALGS